MNKKKEISISKVQLQSSFYKVLYHEYDQLIKAKNLATKGKGMYQLSVKEFFYWLECKGINRIKRVTSTLMIEYYEYLSTRPNKRKGGTLSESTINQHLFSLRMLMDYLVEMGQIQSTVLIPQNSPGTKTERDSVTQKEKDLLYADCKDKREKALLSVAYGCGLRRSEAEQLNTNDINFSSGLLTVRKGKFGKYRDVPMSKSVMRDLKDYLIYERMNYLKEYNNLELSFFINNKGKRMDGDHMNEIVKELITRTKNNKLMQKEIGLHSLRHSIAMHLSENGADIEFIRDFLGHTEIDTSHIYARKNKLRNKQLK